MKNFKYFSTFSGIGGFELGIEQAAKQHGFHTECVGYSEVDKYAISVYNKNFKGTQNYGDITKINTNDLPNFDCLVGGGPCQDVSIIGKRARIKGEKSSLFFEYLRILKDKQPKYFVWENVKGMLSSNEGNDFETVLSSFEELGYSLQWGVLDSQYFGSPQHRERVIVIGFLGECPKEILPIGGAKFKTALEDDCIIALAKRRKRLTRHNYINTITASYYGPSGDGSPGVLIDGNIRRLTPIECERCQLFPDNWTKYGENEELISDNQRYKMCGNAVCVGVIKEVFNKLFDYLDEETK